MKKDERKISMHGTMNSGGGVSFGLNFSGGMFSQEEKERALASNLAQLTNTMFEKGYIRLMSASDIASEYGKSRQFWERLIRQGKIPYQQTSSGRITTNIWVEGYLKGKDEYALNAKKMRDIIINLEEAPEAKGSGRITCVKCGADSFQYYYNQGHHINGSCDNGCGFRVDTQK